MDKKSNHLTLLIYFDFIGEFLLILSFIAFFLLSISFIKGIIVGMTIFFCMILKIITEIIRLNFIKKYIVKKQ